AVPIGLQPIPFDRSGTPPRRVENSDQSESSDGSGRPGSTSNCEGFGPPRFSLEPLDRLSGDEPSSPVPDEHEQPVAAPRAEALDNAVQLGSRLSSRSSLASGDVRSGSSSSPGRAAAVLHRP